jgi:hypothetical protein
MTCFDGKATLQSLHHDIYRLSTLSFPGEASSLSSIEANDALIALDCSELRIHISDKVISSKRKQEMHDSKRSGLVYRVGSIVHGEK